METDSTVFGFPLPLRKRSTLHILAYIMTRQQGFERNEDDKKHKRTFKVEKCDLKQSTEKKKTKQN